ncbi:hypothetical protein DWV06_18175 [Anaerosacchariphilus polymeriproducens]|uniref:Uncharacterized protein n=1 Tax=Anaerosacchariphilus polymeriproducens TaxID=1812858 RepID=A0A371AQS2_9FIRM|nr:hypothetical protein DWV06_18175 [Anaerosacchariphilus polymeriproducens]
MNIEAQSLDSLRKIVKKLQEENKYLKEHLRKDISMSMLLLTHKMFCFNCYTIFLNESLKKYYGIR